MPNADGSIIIKADVDDKDAEKRLNQLNRTIEKTEKELSKLQAQKLPLTKQAEELTVELDKAKERLAYMQSGVEFFPVDSIKAQENSVKAIQKDWDGVQGKLDGVNNKIKYASGELLHAKEEAGELAKKMTSVGYRTKEAMDEVTKKVDKFSDRLKRLAKRVLLFSLFTMALRGVREWFGKIVKTNEEATQSVARLRGALLTLAQPLVEAVLPAFTAIVNALSSIVYIVARLFSAVQGKTVEESAKAAENLNEEVDAIDGVGASAKKASKSLAAFDEINKLAGDSAASSSGGIKPDFSTADLNNLPKLLKNLVFDLEAKIRDLRFSWDEGTLASNQDAWIIALSGVLGAVLGTMFIGINGTFIGLLLGLSIGLISCTFSDKLKNPKVAKDLFIIALGSILGAVLGGFFFGLPGAAIGLALGALISLVGLEFQKGNVSKWDEKDTLTTVLSAILGAILGAAFGGIPGMFVGMLLGASISFIAIRFSEGNYNKGEAIASLRVAVFAILAGCLGAWFGGPVGAGVGLLIGLTIGFASVGFDKKLEDSVSKKARTALGIALNTIIGALVGAAIGGGIFGGIIGGAITLTFTLAINFASAKISDKTGLKNAISNYSSWTGKGFNVPGLATGAVVPPNREFMAVLGDNKRETEVVSPLSTMKQAMLEAMREYGGMGGNGGGDIVLQIDGKAFARVTNPYYKNENSRIGVKMVNGV